MRFNHEKCNTLLARTMSVQKSFVGRNKSEEETATTFFLPVRYQTTIGRIAAHTNPLAVQSINIA